MQRYIEWPAFAIVCAYSRVESLAVALDGTFPRNPKPSSLLPSCPLALVQVANFIHCVIFAFAQKLWLVYANFIFSGLAMLGYSIMSDFISDSVPPEVISDYNPKPYELTFSPPPRDDFPSKLHPNSSHQNPEQYEMIFCHSRCDAHPREKECSETRQPQCSVRQNPFLRTPIKASQHPNCTELSPKHIAGSDMGASNTAESRLKPQTLQLNP